MYDHTAVRLARTVLSGLACLAGTLVGALILIVVLGRGLSGLLLFQAVIFGVGAGTFDYFLASRMRRSQWRIEWEFRDQQRRVR